MMHTLPYAAGVDGWTSEAKGNECARQKWSRDPGQGVCLEAHQDQRLTASLLTNVVEYIKLMKKQGIH